MDSMKLQKVEPVLFYAMLIVTMVPALLYRFFPTMDGPAHLYNSNLIVHLLFNHGSPVSDFFMINPVPVPNWLSHFILALLNAFLPAFMAEKIFIVAFMTFLPLSFRYLVRQYQYPWLSLLIFPFCYSFLFCSGFYNYSIGMILVFISLAVWKRYEGKLTLRATLLMFFLITCAWFTHILIYAFLLLALGWMIIRELMQNLLHNPPAKPFWLATVRKSCVLLLITLPSLVMVYIFISHVSMEGSATHLPFSTLMRWIAISKPLIVYGEREIPFTTLFSVACLFLIAVIVWPRKRTAALSPRSATRIVADFLLMPGNAFLLMTLVALVLFLFIPNASNAGMMSDRFLLLFFFFLITWIALHHVPQWAIVVSWVMILTAHFILLTGYTKEIRNLNRDATAMYKVSQFIEPNCIVLPVTLSDNWLHTHFSNYLGADNSVIITENYEANVGWFPVVWNTNKAKAVTFGNLKRQEPFFLWYDVESDRTVPADYIFIIGSAEKLEPQEKEALREDYTLRYASSNGYIRLFVLK